MLKSIFEITPKELEKLIIPSSNKLSLQLKQGKFTALSGTYTKGNRDLNIRFNYNRSFVGNRNISKAGSWTTTLRPDYTLSIWPSDLKETQAEAKEQIVHIHFDAKYKIANIQQILENKQDEELNNEKKDNLKGIYKNVDLLKMHAYKDAIRRTSGAYVLYPGDTNKRLKGFHEILPGLGAFPIKPSENTNETIHLEDFLKEVLNHFLNNASQRENIASKAYNIHKSTAPNIIKEPIPEYIDGEKLIPDETYVLVGYYKSKEQLEWVLDSKNRKYNFRTGIKKGSYPITENEVKAKYLVLHGPNETTTSKIYELDNNGVLIYSKQNLIDKGYPSTPSSDLYLMYGIKEEVSLKFNQVKFNLTELDNFKNFRSSPIPITISLTELLDEKVIVK